MYSITYGLVHPRLYDENISNYNFYDIGEYIANTDIVINLMDKVLDPSSSNNIVNVFEDFFHERNITDFNNIYYQRIASFFIEYHKWYTGRKKSAFRFYLVKKNENQVVDVLKTWNTYRETNA